jgi:hypothetical protein
VLAELGLAGGGVAGAPGADQPVDLAHEHVEVGAAPGLDRGGLEEQVHQHGLAAAHGAEQIDPALTLGLAEEGGQAIGLGGGQVGLQAHEGGEARGLGRVRTDRACGEAGVVGGLQGGGHRSPPSVG